MSKPIDLEEAKRKAHERMADPDKPEGMAEVDAQIIDWNKLDGRIAPPREFVLKDWIPRRAVTLLHGFGGVGKTLLAQQLGTAAAFNREMLGHPVIGAPVIGWFGEDEHDEIWRRQENINAALGIHRIADLAGKVFWRPCPDKDITLFEGSTEDSFKTTDNYEILKRQVAKTRAKLVALDSATQIAALPEGNRPLVTRCIQALNAICMGHDTTIILIGHNNRGGDFSGSTAWENRARARIHMRRGKPPGQDDDTVMLCRPKANYADLEDGVAIEWHRGAYRCTDQRFETPDQRLDRKLKEGADDQIFLDILDLLTSQKRALSHSKNSPGRYAPKVMAACEAANGLGVHEFETAMERLFNEGRIVANTELPWCRDQSRHPAVGLARVWS